MVMPTHWLMGYFYPRPPRGGRPVRCCRPACSHHHFYPRPPRGGRQTAVSTAVKGLIFLSTPSARRATYTGKRGAKRCWYFYPRPPRGGRPLNCAGVTDTADRFLSTPSARRATLGRQKSACHGLRFLSTPSARRATLLIITGLPVYFHFYPRPPRGGRPYTPQLHGQGIFISIHALREEGDWLFSSVITPPLVISIHALREEGDDLAVNPKAQNRIFLSTPSARRATHPLPPGDQPMEISIHALREEGDWPCRLFSVFSRYISIHALREEGDLQSCGDTRGCSAISIHALREEGDKVFAYFSKILVDISIHALREEGDRLIVLVFRAVTLFLSTPSARRATAKTERKHPAFVSLYTSLHKLQRDVCKPNRKITPLLAQTAGIPVRSVPENHVCCRFALAGHQKISTLSCANSGCSPTCSTLVW